MDIIMGIIIQCVMHTKTLGVYYTRQNMVINTGDRRNHLIQSRLSLRVVHYNLAP